MQNLEQIQDRDTLQQAALLLERTVIRLQKENATLRAQIARLQGQIVDPQMELDLLREQLEAMKHELYGPSSEKRPRQTDEPKPDEEKPRRGHGPRSQPSLPIVIVPHTLPEEERQCTVCGGHLQEMGSQCEESEEISVVEASYKVVKHRRQKYRCQCNGNVVTAPGPDKLIPGGRYSVELALHVAEAKYLDHQPLERQVRMMGRRGLDTDSQTLWDQIDALARHLEPTYEALCRKVLEAEVVLADETRWQLMGSKGSTSRWWAWCVASQDMATYRILGHRSTAAAQKMLGGYRGVIMTDGYEVYQVLQRAGPGVTLAHCWAHVRRKFIEAEDGYPELSRFAVKLIGKLFEVERRVPKLEPGASEEEREQRLELRRKLREEESQPVVDELWQLALDNRSRVLPRSKMGKAISYMTKLWTGLTLFLKDPRVPLTNNGAERALRGVVVGRKNHYGSRSKRGTEVAALFYTLFETAKLSGVDPGAYVLEAARRAIDIPGTVTLPTDVT